MKRRTTFFHEGGANFDPSQLSLSSNALEIRDLHAARQERFTFAIDEVPDELRNLLEQYHELYLRWTSHAPHEAIGPFSSRAPAGLYIQVAPRGEDDNGKLCTALKGAFTDELHCSTIQTSFTPLECHPQQTCEKKQLQYYHLLPTLDHFISWAEQQICRDNDGECMDLLSTLHAADSLDIDYEEASNTVKVSSYWSTPISGPWNEVLESTQHGADRAEVGVLALQKATQPHKLSVGGFIATIGEHKELKSSMFSFASRHHPMPAEATYSAQFLEPTGLHPTLQISIPAASLHPPDMTCNLHTYLSLPHTIFPDQYQLKTNDTLSRKSHGWKTVKSVTGELDLEAPDWTVKTWGSDVLIELDTPDEGEDLKAMNVTIPLHLRYLPPAEGGFRNISVSWPIVFWACDGPEERFSPFDRRHLGYDMAFPPDTSFYNLHPQRQTTTGEKGDIISASAPFVETIDVPVLRISDEGGWLDSAGIVENATVLVILVAFGYLVYILNYTGMRPRATASKKKD